MQTQQFDVIVVGGSLVGASAAVALAKQGLRVALLDRALPSFAAENDAVWDSRIYAISPGNADWLKDLNVWQAMVLSRVMPIDAMQICSDEKPEPLIFSADEAHAENLGYILENKNLHSALWQNLESFDVEILEGEAQHLNFAEDFAYLALKDGTQLKASLLVGADGGNSWVREQAGLSQQKTVYEHVGVVANFETELPHQGIARQWFVEDGILAWLPLPGRRISMVFSTKHSQDLMAMSPEALCEYVAQIGGHALGGMRCITPAQAFPLVKQKANAFIGPRLALIGDAAHQVHPMAGQGVNLGFRDVVALAQALSERHPSADVGDHFVLRRYERARKADVLGMHSLTHGLYGLFDSHHPAIKAFRNWGLYLPNDYPVIKRALMKHALI
jgi:ubiquinone biosynthesis UbiH/UbiF/VisC/COQ6 family hydroxylase